MFRYLAAALVLAACATGPEPAATTYASSADGATEASDPTWNISRPFTGFSLSPPAIDSESFNLFFRTAAEGARLVAWDGAWQQISEGGTLVYELADQYDYVPVVVTGFPTGLGGLPDIPEDPTEMIDSVTQWVTEHPVPFLGFGVELNTLPREETPHDFESYVQFFSDLAVAVHLVSPETVVFPGFQLERLRGLRGGLLGEEDTAAEWELIDRFPDAEGIGFTTYPGLIFSDPGEIPTDYYIEILEHTDKPVVFTEVGWQAGGELGEWSGTPEKQATFVSRHVGELVEMADMVTWSFLFDPPGASEAFATMGLFDASGQARPAWHSWQDLLQ